MNKNDIVLYLKALSATNIHVAGTWVTASCPLAPWQHESGKDAHPSFAIRVKDDAESHYNCFTCGGGDLITLLHKLKMYGAELPKYDLKTAMALAVDDGLRPVKFTVKEWGESVVESEYVTFPELWLSSFVHATSSSIAMEYLTKRNLDVKTIERLDLRYDSRINGVAFPLRDFAGTLCGLRARRIEPVNDEPRYHMYRSALGSINKVVWYGESWLNFDKPIVVCESLFDVASVFRVYENVCGPMTATFVKETAERMKAATRIITLFDGDKAGNLARARLHKFLPNTEITDLYPPDGCKDPGEMSRAEIAELLTKFVKLKAGVDHEQHQDAGA